MWKFTNVTTRQYGNNMSENKLGDESSPYLLQHAKNPVHWYAWNDDALARAKKENKPIFLSVGYLSLIHI